MTQILEIKEGPISNNWILDRESLKEIASVYSSAFLKEYVVPIRLNHKDIGVLVDTRYDSGKLRLIINSDVPLDRYLPHFSVSKAQVLKCSVCGSLRGTCDCNAPMILRGLRFTSIKVVSICSKKRAEISDLSNFICSSIFSAGECTDKIKEEIEKWNIMASEYMEKCKDDNPDLSLIKPSSRYVPRAYRRRQSNERLFRAIQQTIGTDP